MAKPIGKITDKQRKFIDEYFIDLNATQASIRAGYSERTANRIAAQLLQKPHIQKAIQARQRELQAATEITQERVLEELAAVAFSDMSDYVKVHTANVTDPDTGKATHITEVLVTDTELLDAKQRRAVASLRQGTCGVEVKLYDKLRALERLGEYLGLFRDAGQNGLSDGARIVIDASDDYGK